MTDSAIRDECLKQFGLEKFRKFANSLVKTSDNPPAFATLKFWQQSIVDKIAMTLADMTLDNNLVCAALHSCDIHGVRLIGGEGYQIHGFRNPETFQRAREQLFPFGYDALAYHCPVCRTACELWIDDHADECLISAKSMSDSFPDRIEMPNELGWLCEAYRIIGYPLSGCFRLREHDEDAIQKWFGSEAVAARFAQFGSNADGSMYCLWRSPNGKIPVVYLAAQGEPNMVVASSMLQFIRLLAIGYSEIGYDDLTRPPEDATSIDTRFKEWVAENFNTTILETGAEIVRAGQIAHPNFEAWIETRRGNL
jgi:hypothetical protein